jgi:stage II sporulation protein D
VRVEAADGRVTVVGATPEGLRAGGAAVGPLWRAARPEPLRVAGRRVRGEVEVRRTPDGLRVVNGVPLEDYVAGTLGREVYPGWHAEALKAQAVVARTYALHERDRRRAEGFHLRADTSGQVYGGIDAESEPVRAAAADTRGQYLAFGGAPILAVYHSAAGGRTASAEEVWGRAVPYLVSQPVDDEEDSPDAYWRVAVSRTTLGRALAPVGVQVGSIRALRVLDRSRSGRVQRVSVRGERGEAEVEARRLRRALGAQVIRSTLFEVRDVPEGFLFVGAGHGHGVGMSQWGAQAMARRGRSYREILAAFYPDTELVGIAP